MLVYIIKPLYEFSKNFSFPKYLTYLSLFAFLLLFMPVIFTTKTKCYSTLFDHITLQLLAVLTYLFSKFEFELDCILS